MRRLVPLAHAVLNVTIGCLGTLTSSLLDPKTLHQLHTLIFLIAVFHVTYSMIVMVISEVRRWLVLHTRARIAACRLSCKFVCMHAEGCEEVDQMGNLR